MFGYILYASKLASNCGCKPSLQAVPRSIKLVNQAIFIPAGCREASFVPSWTS